jgi:hypothetical protein
MNLYVFERVDHVTENWHHEGGVLVVAVSQEDALRQLNEARREAYSYLAKPLDDISPTPDRVYPLAPGDWQPSLLVFPDAGCC